MAEGRSAVYDYGPFIDVPGTLCPRTFQWRLKASLFRNTTDVIPILTTEGLGLRTHFLYHRSAFLFRQCVPKYNSMEDSHCLRGVETGAMSKGAPPARTTPHVARKPSRVLATRRQTGSPGIKPWR